MTTTNAQSSKQSVALLRASSLAMLGLLSLMLLLQGCPSRQQIKAEAWEQSGLPAKLCADNPELGRYGMYRLLDTGKYEFISYCTQVPSADGKTHNAVADYTAFNTMKLDEILDGLLGKE